MSFPVVVLRVQSSRAGSFDVLTARRQEFLRDGDQLAARMTGTLKLDGAETAFESFIFATVDRETGKVASLIERGVYGPVGGVPEHGIK